MGGVPLQKVGATVEEKRLILNETQFVHMRITGGVAWPMVDKVRALMQSEAPAMLTAIRN